ncbi:MAG TPA: sulfur carrier protein ThiS [Candidatus Baltobacteraceae bacterium]|nr:sulfur carrier protein ThiS [Candidatus Baltobacteraceae bacterium]
MKASINGKEHDLPDGLTIAQLLSNLNAPPAGIAVARNDRVIRRAAFADEALQDGDRIEIINAVAGG